MTNAFTSKRHPLARLAFMTILLLNLSLSAHAQATEGPTTALQSLQTLDDSQIAARPLSIRAYATHERTRVLFIETHALPIVDISVRFSAGSSRDGDLPGLANLTLKLLNQGVEGMDAKAITETFDQLGAQLTASVDKDEARLTLRTLSDGQTRKAAIDLFTRLIAQPAFAPAAVERAKASALNAIGLVQQNPTARLQQTLHAQVYGNHPYARPVEGNAQSLALIDAEKVRGFHQNAYTAANALLVIVGDISNDEATDLSIAISQALPQGPALAPVELAMDLTSPPGHTHLEAPYSQTLIMLAQPSVPANHPDYVALQVASLIFGGSNSSRLINELRHKRGLSYAASAFIPLWQAGGPWTISLQTAPDQQDATLALVKTLFAEWLRDGPTEEELVAVKRRLAGNLPLTSASNAQMVQQLLLMGAHDLPRNFDALVIHAQKLSRQDIKDAINRYTRADKWKVASLGPTVEQRPLSAVQP